MTDKMMSAFPLPTGTKPVIFSVPLSARIKEGVSRFRKTHHNAAAAGKVGLGAPAKGS